MLKKKKTGVNITFCTLLYFSFCLGFGMVKIDLKTKSCSGVVSTQYNFNRCSIINLKEPVKKLFRLVVWVSVHLALCCPRYGFVILSDFSEHLCLRLRQSGWILGEKKCSHNKNNNKNSSPHNKNMLSFIQEI